jgi:hypothetical protein
MVKIMVLYKTIYNGLVENLFLRQRTNCGIPRNHMKKFLNGTIMVWPKTSQQGLQKNHNGFIEYPVQS